MSDARSIREERLARSKGSSVTSRQLREERMAQVRSQVVDDGGKSVGGFLGNLAGNVKDAALGIPAGIAAAAPAGAEIASFVSGRSRGFKNTKELATQLADQYRYQYGPLAGGDFGEFASRLYENPLGPILDVASVASLGAGAAARGAAVTSALKTGEVAKAARAVVSRPPAGTRSVRVGELEAKTPASRSALARGGQRLSDKTLQGLADRRPGGRAEAMLQNRARRWEERRRRVEDARARSKANRLLAAGKKLKPDEQMALRMVAEEAPVKKRIAASELRAAQAKDKREAGRHRERIDLMEGAQKFLDESSDKPQIRPEFTKLSRVMEMVRDVARDRDGMLAAIDRLSPEAGQAAKTQAGRVALSAKFKTYTLDKVAPASPYALAGRNVTDLATGDTAKVVSIDRSAGTARVRYYDQAARRYSEHERDLSQLRLVGERRGAVVGAESFEASPEAVHIGAPVRKTRLTGAPRVGERTIGQPGNPESLRRATGRARETAQERLDTTKIVAERNLEAVRLTGILRARDRLEKAGSPVPIRSDDVFMRLGKLPSSKRLPSEVRRFLDDPDSVASLDEAEAAGIVDRLRDEIFPGQLRLDPASRAEFEALAEQGKGTFVPRRLVGDLVKRSPHLSGTMRSGVKLVDEINNAQKLSAIYLKPGYVAPQMLGNAFFNLTQQGWAAPRNLTWAVRMNHKLGAEATAVVDDLMGEGLIRQLSGEGQSPLGRVTTFTAGKLSRVVDVPFRRSSFLYEAHKAGYRNAEQIKRLLNDDSLADDLFEVVTRANQEIIDFAAMSPIERSVVRRVVFLYPWLKGSTVYAGRFLRDKPVQANVLSSLAEEGQRRSEEAFGPLPSYLEGAIPIGGRISNPSSFSPFQTPVQNAQFVRALFGGGGARSEIPLGALSPAASMLIERVTGKNAFGRPAGSVLNTLNQEMVQSQPLAGLARALGVGEKRGTLYQDTVQDALLRYVVGGFWPRRYNKGELNLRARRGD